MSRGMEGGASIWLERRELAKMVCVLLEMGQPNKRRNVLAEYDDRINLSSTGRK